MPRLSLIKVLRQRFLLQPSTRCYIWPAGFDCENGRKTPATVYFAVLRCLLRKIAAFPVVLMLSVECGEQTLQAAKPIRGSVTTVFTGISVRTFSIDTGGLRITSIKTVATMFDTS